MTVNQQMTFHDADTGFDYSIGNDNDATFEYGANHETDLGDFLARPIEIHAVTWTEGTQLADTFNPWEKYFGQARIKEKLRGYARLSCTLNLAIKVNASPFYYGLAMLSYDPLPDFSHPVSVIVAGDEQLVSYSQRPHIYLRPQENMGGSMSLPFIYYKQKIDISKLSDIQEMGVCRFDSFGVLENANGVVGSNTSITVYAWASDISLSVPTTSAVLQGGIELQGKAKKGKKKNPFTVKEKITSFGSQSDEYGDGPVSGVASAIAGAAGMLSSVPIIGPYMRATQVGAGSISRIASWFGFSPVAVIDNTAPMKNMPYTDMASSEIAGPFSNLTLDPKNELCIDSRTVGLDGQDELSIQSIVTRESYLTIFPWGSEAPGTTLFSSNVTPNLYRHKNDLLWGTPMSHVAAAFETWTGDITFRFQVICSQYHRGRLSVSWDPNQSLSGVSTQDTTLLAYTQIVDIAETRDFDFTIPYASAEAFLRTNNLDYTRVAFGTALVHAPNKLFDNGQLTVRVLNDLTSPSASAPISISVSVAGCDNLKFANPIPIVDRSYGAAIPLEVQGLVLQSEICEAEMRSPEEGAPISQNEDKLGITNGDSDSLFNVYYGEEIASIRTLMHRYQYSRTSLSSSIASNGPEHLVVVQNLMSRYPLPNGRDANGIDVWNTVPANISNMTYQSYFSACYKGHRGSMRWKALVHGIGAEFESCTAERNARSVRTLNEYNRFHSMNSTLSDANNLLRYQAGYPAYGSTGMSLTNGRTQAGIEFNAPMFSRFRMIPTKPGDVTMGNTKYDTERDSIDFKYVFNPESFANPGDTIRGKIDFYCATGVDYNLFLFLNVPTLHTGQAPIPT